ncbi:MAG: carbohydrate-binding protein [Bacteroides sp.]|nr:carbohydrate-binding protein [Bacteroides sp.]
MLAVGSGHEKSIIAVRGVFFSGAPDLFRATAAGHGTLEVRLDQPDGEVLASISFGTDTLQTVSTKIDTDKDGIHNLYFVFKGKELKVDEWMFERF